MKKFFLFGCSLTAIAIGKAQYVDTTKNALQPIIITANKIAQKLNETGKVITVIGKDALDRSMGKDLSQLLNEQAGLVINGANSNPGKDKSVFLWGAKNGYTLILVDGIPVYDASGVTNVFDMRMLPIDQIERIEIVKGSQSTLYGTDAIAGVIHIITKKNSNKPIDINGMLSYGSYNTLKGNMNVSGKKSIVDYAINYQRLHTDGISEALDTTGKAHYDKDGYWQQAIQAKLGVHLTPQVSINPFFQYTQFNGKFDDYRLFIDNVDNRFKSKLISAGAKIHFTNEKWDLVGMYNYQQFKREYTYPLLFDSRFQHAEVYTKYNVNNYLQILAGTTLQQYQFIDTAVKNPHYSIYSGYVNVFFKAKNGWHVELGGRYNHHSKYGNTLTYSINPSYYIKDEQLRLFVNVASGYKAPSLYQLYGLFSGNSSLKPELSKTIEIGFDKALQHDLIQLRAVGFYRNIKDVIVYDNNTFTYANSDKQQDYGIEMETSIKPNTHLDIKINYTYVDGELLTKSVSGKDSSFVGLIRVPKHTININISYKINKQWYINASFQRMSSRIDIQSVKLLPYSLCNVYTSYTFLKRIKAFIDVKNIFNTKYTEVYGYATLGTNAHAGIQFSL